MSENLHLVFSTPPEGLGDEEYNRWYDAHLAEILVVPGFVAARRYRLESAVSSKPPAQNQFLSAYEIEGEPSEVMKALDVEVASGRMQLPDWFPQIRFTSFNGHSHGNDSDPTLVDHLYLVFSAPPEGIDDGDYVEWYREHAAENTQVPGFLRNWRFRLEPEVVDAAAPTTSSHLAAYEVDGDLATLRAALDKARQVNEIHFPPWFGQIPFVSLDAVAIGPRVAGLRSRS
jgi:hypothetical protein